MNAIQQVLPVVEEEYWQALVTHDARYDGVVYFGVRTTGVYCRPVCKSRLPRRENVVFFATWQAAEQAGFRPCKRCTPRDPDEDAARAAVLKACQRIEQAEVPPSLQTLAEEVGLSPFYFQRLFKKVVGVSPKQYALQMRANRLRDALQAGPTVTDAIYNAGYNSNSPFYAQSAVSLGMKPSDYKKGAPGVNLSYAILQSTLGWVLIARTEVGVCAVELGDSPELLESRLAQRFPGAALAQPDAHTAAWAAQVVSYMESPDQPIELPLDIRGTAFQRRVWLALRGIPCGRTASYAEVAAQVGSPKAVRAVANACASNQLAVVIPCHRVVRSDGGLGGYRWGVERKRKLLEREKGVNGRYPGRTMS